MTREERNALFQSVLENIMGSIKTLSRTRDQLTEILQTNGLLTEDEMNFLL